MADFKVLVTGVSVEKNGEANLNAQLVFNSDMRPEGRGVAMSPSFKLKDAWKFKLDGNKAAVEGNQPGSKLLNESLRNSLPIRSQIERDPNGKVSFFKFKTPEEWTVTCDSMKFTTCQVSEVKKTEKK